MLRYDFPSLTTTFSNYLCEDGHTRDVLKFLKECGNSIYQKHITEITFTLNDSATHDLGPMPKF